MFKNYFLSIITMLSLGISNSFFPMEQSGPLDNQLKPIAKTLESELKLYEDNKVSHPKEAEDALKSSMIISKGLYFVTANKIHQVQVQKTASKTEAGIKGIDLIAPQINRLDPSLNEHESRILAAYLLAHHSMHRNSRR